MSINSSYSTIQHRPRIERMERSPEQLLAASPPVTEQSSSDADYELAVEYQGALQFGNWQRDDKIGDIPPGSTFYKWWSLLLETFQSPDVRQWIEDKGIDRTTIKLNLESGQITFALKQSLDPNQALHTIGQDDPQWAAISEPIFAAADVVTAGSDDTDFKPPTGQFVDRVAWQVIGRFYQEPQDLTADEMRQRAMEIRSGQGFKQPDADRLNARSEEALRAHEAVLGDTRNRYTAAAELGRLATSIENGTTSVDDIQDQLKERIIEFGPGSTYHPEHGGKWNRVSLLQYLNDHGMHIPTDQAELENLATALTTPARKAAANGDLGGALTWPVPLDKESQRQLRADIQTGKFGAVNASPFNNVLEYLLEDRSISPEELSNPRLLIDSLVNSPKGEALAAAIQAAFEARQVKGSASDWLLAAMNFTHDDESSDGLTVKGYPLYSVENANKSASTIVKELANHLVVIGDASSPEKALVQAHLLLASRAPEFLVKDVPDQVTPGTHSWVSFATAVRRIEAKAPGATATMSYAQIMQEASIAPVTQEESLSEYAAQSAALKGWYVANGHELPSSDVAMAEVRKAFSTQVNELREAAETSVGDMPTRRELALEQLKKAFPDMDPHLFEEKTITIDPPHSRLEGPYSILDSYIDGRPLFWTPNRLNVWKDGFRELTNLFVSKENEVPPDATPGKWVSSSSAFDLDEVTQKLKELPRPDALFDEKIHPFLEGLKKTTSASFKFAISKLSLEDRQNLEFSKVTVYKAINYHRADHPIRVEKGVLLVKTERNGKVMTYAFDRNTGTVTPRPDQSYKENRPTDGFYPQPGNRFDEIKPAGEQPAGIADEKTGVQGTPDSFGSPRTQYLVDAVLEDLDLPAVHTYAKGATTFNTEVPTFQQFNEVAFNLTPIAPAVRSFIDGKIGEGIADLAIDLLGFAVGVGAAAKGLKGLSAGAKALKGLKILGRAAIGALNPVDGFVDLGRGALKLGRKAVGSAYKGVKQLRGTYRSVDLLALAKRADIAEGTYKLAGRADDINTLAKWDKNTEKWFAYNPKTRTTYGKAINDFKAQKPAANIDEVAGASAGAQKSYPSLLEQGLANDNVIELGGAMKDFKVIETEVHVFVDRYKGTERLNIAAHGNPYVSNNKRFGRNNADIIINGKHYSAAELVELLKSKGIDPKKFDNIRLLICHSAEGGSKSFGAQLQKVVKKPVKAFEGPVTASHGPTAIADLRAKYVEKLKANNHDMTNAYANQIANDYIRSDLNGKDVLSVNKHHGSTIEVNMADIGEPPRLEIRPIVYQPKQFGKRK